MTGRLAKALRHFATARQGSTTMIFAVSAIGLLGLAGAAIDYTNLSGARARFQAVADAAALAGAKEFRLGNASTTTVGLVAQNFALASLRQQSDPGSTQASVTPSVDSASKTVTVTIDANPPTYFAQLLGVGQAQVRVSATAKVTGGAPICAIGLDTEATSTILMDKSARLQAMNCAVYSNSTKPNGLVAKNSASMVAAFICSAGGKSGAGPGSFSPVPQSDCPVLPDPLAARPQPASGGCLYTDLVVSGISTTLTPGTYCGGITMTNGAAVTLQSGTYTIKNGPLRVTGGASLSGINVGLFLSGPGAEVKFDGPSSISLTAPRDGVMAGMLMFEDRASPLGQTHEILSNDARNLLGTIYLPQGRLHVAAQKPVADLSPYTIVVARQFTLSEGPTMVLNSNYSATNIPVPAGVGPNSNRTALVH